MDNLRNWSLPILNPVFKINKCYFKLARHSSVLYTGGNSPKMYIENTFEDFVTHRSNDYLEICTRNIRELLLQLSFKQNTVSTLYLYNVCKR